MLLIPIWNHAIYTGGDAINLAHHTTVEFKCTTNGDRTPDWFVNGSVVVTTGGSYRSRTSNGRDITTTLTIDGNGTQVTWNIYCEVYEEHQFVRVHSTTVIFQGLLQSSYRLMQYSPGISFHELVLILNSLSQVFLPHPKRFSPTHQLLNGDHLTLLWTMTSFMWTPTSPSTLFTLLTIILETLLS